MLFAMDSPIITPHGNFVLLERSKFYGR